MDQLPLDTELQYTFGAETDTSLEISKSAAISFTLIETEKLNGVDSQARLTDVLGRIADHKITNSTRFCHGVTQKHLRNRATRRVVGQDGQTITKSAPRSELVLELLKVMGVRK